MRHNSWRPTKYYHFNGQTVAMRKNGVLSYLHGDRVPTGRGSTVATSNSSGTFSGQEWYHARPRLKPQADTLSWLKPNCAVGASPALADFG